MPPSSPHSPDSDARLTLTALGGVSLARHRDGHPPETVFGPGKPLALVTYLASAPGRTATREHLIDLLWSDVEPDAARHALRQTLWYIRRRAGDPLIAATSEALTLTAPLDSDCERFVAAIGRGDHEAAVALYSGDFLPNFAVPGGGEFERWADLERQRLRSAFVRAAEALTRKWLSSGRLRDAQALARRVRDADPLGEGAWRLVIESFLSGSDGAAAARAADELERVLAAEAREPEPPTRAMLRRVRAMPESSGATDGAAGLVSELVGREREFATIVSAWDKARTGTGRHVHLVAPSGAGKTRLLGDTAARLRAVGARVVAVRANPGERHIAYALASELAAALGQLRGAAAVSPGAAGVLVALNPRLSASLAAAPDLSSGDDALRRRTIAMAELAESVAGERPLALLVDDLHWADPPSRQLLAGVLTHIADHGILALTAARPSEPGFPLATGATQLVLAPLTPTDVSCMLASLATMPDDGWTEQTPDALHAASGGSPLLVLETLQLALERGSLVIRNGGWECPDPDRLAAELRAGAALRHRLGALPPAPRRAVELLAVAGTPLLTATVARAAGEPEADTEGVLIDLEQRGFVTRSGSGWRPAHDELAAAAEEALPPNSVREIHAAVGRALADDEDGDRRALRGAAAHLALGGDDARLARVAALAVRRARLEGDERPLPRLVEELLGEAASPERARAVVRALPARVRIRPYAGWLATAGAVATIALVTLTTLALRGTEHPVPDALFRVTVVDDSGSTLRRDVGVFREEWEARSTIDLRAASPAARSPALPAALLGARDLRAGPGPTVGSRLYPDSGGIDLVMVEPDGRERRLTRTGGDDVGPSWSPDGREVAFSTARWSDSSSHLDLAVLDTATGLVHRMTRTAEREEAPRWSPDGAHIAFVRRPFDLREPELCWVQVDGSGERCLHPDSLPVVTLLAWSSPEYVLAALDTAGALAVALVQLPSGRTEILDVVPQPPEVSPDGRWVACLCPKHADPELRWYVYPTGSPALARPVDAGDGRRVSAVQWIRTAEPSYVQGIRIEAPAGGASVGTRTKLRVRGVDRSGRLAPLSTVSWSSLDTVVATIDASSGLLNPRRGGLVRIEASAGGWRKDTIAVRIRPSAYAREMDESWRGGPGAWRFFGDPPPRLVIGPEGIPAMWNRGDGGWQSGVYSRRSFSAGEGAGIEFQLSTPISAPQWQVAAVALAELADSTDLSAWDHRTGALPGIGGPGGGVSCRFTWPAGEGRVNIGRAVLMSGTVQHVIALPDSSLQKGRWFTGRIQIFSDGRCGFAVDRHVLWISDNAIPLDRPVHAVLAGNSVGTRILVGTVEIWRGVRTDIDWQAAPDTTDPPR